MRERSSGLHSVYVVRRRKNEEALKIWVCSVKGEEGRVISTSVSPRGYVFLTGFLCQFHYTNVKAGQQK